MADEPVSAIPGDAHRWAYIGSSRGGPNEYECVVCRRKFYWWYNEDDDKRTAMQKQAIPSECVAPPSEATPPTDEWSNPVKDKDIPYWWSGNGRKRFYVGPDGLEVSDPDGAIEIPRDAVLRLLAAEASDRLGWVWEVERFPGSVRVKKAGKHYVNWMDDPPEGTVDISGGTTDEILAAMHGRFLLLDALEGR